MKVVISSKAGVLELGSNIMIRLCQRRAACVMEIGGPDDVRRLTAADSPVKFDIKSSGCLMCGELPNVVIRNGKIIKFDECDVMSRADADLVELARRYGSGRMIIVDAPDDGVWHIGRTKDGMEKVECGPGVKCGVRCAGKRVMP